MGDLSIFGMCQTSVEPPSYTPTSERTGALMDLFLGCCVTGSKVPQRIVTASYSNYRDPIDQSTSRLAGYSREYGAASSENQMKVIKMILDKSSHLSSEDQAILLGMARIESGFNPDAAAKSTSAAGVFQFINSTGRAYGLNESNRFDAESNVTAGIKLYSENLKILNRRYPNLAGDERAVMLYALHHDGPSLKYGGASIAREKLLPFIDRFRNLSITYRDQAGMDKNIFG